MFNVGNKENNNTIQKTHNTPSSVQRSFKYQNCYILNNLNNYQPKVIMGNKTKSNNKFNNIILNNKKEIAVDNNSINNTCNISKKTNGTLIASNNNGSNDANNLLVGSPINCLNTITFNINNNYNNCCNNYINENDGQKNYIQFEGFNGQNGLGRINCKSLSNLNQFSNFPSCEKINKNIDEENNLNININNTIKEINSLKNNKNNNKRSTLLKVKSKAKNKSSQNIYPNTTNTNTNNTKKSNKSSVNNTNSLNNGNTSNINNIINGSKYKSKENENINTYLETNSNNNTNSYSKVNNKDLLYETAEDNCYNENYFNNINNDALNSNKKDFRTEFEELDAIKSLNTVKSNQRNFSKNDNAIVDNYNLENTTYKSSGSIAYQTYSGPFRKNIIKVNMLDKNTKNENININNGNTNAINEKIIFNPQKKVYKKNISNSSKKSEKKNVNIQNDSKGCKKYKKNNNISKLNSNNDRIKNNILIENYCQEKEDQNNLELKNENEDICNNNESETKKEETQINPKERYLFNNLSMTNYYKLNKNSSQSNISSNLNLNILSVNSKNNNAYVKKKSPNMNLHNEYVNIASMTNRSSVFKNKKKYSISQSCYNTQRNSKDTKLNIKNKNTNKYNCLNSTKKNKNENKTVVIPEYKVKLENLKSRVTNLLNIYSLLALKNINIPKINSNKDVEIEDDIGSEEY